MQRISRPAMFRTFIAFLLALACSAASPTTQSAISRFSDGKTDASDAIAWRISQLPRVDGVTHARYPMGGTIELPAGTFTISKSIRLFSGVKLKGEGTATVLNYTGSDYAIIFDGKNHCYASVESMQLCSDTGGGIRYADLVTFVKGDVLRDLWISTKMQAISLRTKLEDGCVFNPTIERIEFLNLGSGALDARTTNGRFAQLMLTHRPRADFTPPTCGAMLSFEGRCIAESIVAEENSDTVLVRFASADDGPGNFSCAGIHMEPAARTDGKVIPAMIVDHSILHHSAVLFYGTATNPIVVKNGAKLTASIVTDGGVGAVRVDPASNLIAEP